MFLKSTFHNFNWQPEGFYYWLLSGIQHMQHHDENTVVDLAVTRKPKEDDSTKDTTTDTKK